MHVSHRSCELSRSEPHSAPRQRQGSCPWSDPGRPVPKRGRRTGIIADESTSKVKFNSEVPQASGQCLDVGGQATADGSSVGPRTGNGGTGQAWFRQ